MKNVEIRRVWNHNLETEFSLIQSMIRYYPFLSIDTEFPGTVFQYSDSYTPLTPASKYELMKANVDNTNIIQLGLTLSDNNGNLPSFGTNSCYIWEFNFWDFDVERDLQNTSSTRLLESQGIDFMENKERGIRSSHFALLWRKFLLFSKNRLTWAFHSAYDFGYLIKMLNHNRLPQDINTFTDLMDIYFGKNVYDIKSMIRVSGEIYGGLERVANKLGVDRVAGKSHQAASDSLLTWQTFRKLSLIRVSREILERVVNKLGVDRVAGKSHQDASDSLLTWQMFRKLSMIRVSREIYGGLERVANKLGVDRVAGKTLGRVIRLLLISLQTWRTFRSLQMCIINRKTNENA